MKPHKIWIEQCEAAKGIETEFGTHHRLEGRTADRYQATTRKRAAVPLVASNC